jgi:hypothetical protein
MDGPEKRRNEGETNRPRRPRYRQGPANDAEEEQTREDVDRQVDRVESRPPRASLTARDRLRTGRPLTVRPAGGESELQSPRIEGFPAIEPGSSKTNAPEKLSA